MTETEWLACPDRDMLLDHVFPRASRRKLRLFLCALARRLWPQLIDPQSRRAVEVAEDLADELADTGLSGAEQTVADRWIEVRKAASEALERARPANRNAAGVACYTLALLMKRYLPYLIKHQAAIAANAAAQDAGESVRRTEMAAQGRLIRDLFGNPFRPPRLDPAWLRWREGIVEKWTRRIYDERRFDELPVLADALEDAGCDDRAILAHCRGAGEHVRGCWVVDLLLGKS